MQQKHTIRQEEGRLFREYCFGGGCLCVEEGWLMSSLVKSRAV